ncbi:hypothetical protein INR49_018900 [Caranx melampygus]|nr:hypothetical protein INR49_018900 [Caranx melampygus]
MLLTHCVMGWTVLTVLSLCLPVWSALTVIQPYRSVAINGTAQVLCFIQPQPSFHLSKAQSSGYPYHNPEKIRVSLLKGLQNPKELCLLPLNLPESRNTRVEKQEEMQCSVELREGALVVTVSGLKATDTDIYRCGIELLYPPPYLQVTGNGTLIHVIDTPKCPAQEAHTVLAHQGDGEEDYDEGDERMAVSVPVVVLVTLVIIVLIIIIYFQMVQCERGRREIIRSVKGGPYKVEAVAFSCDNVV